jgi:S1-C subfamily serine protease
MLNGTMIENTVVGGPAHNSKQFEHGDVILEVDGQEAKNANIFELLIGSDIPGSAVEVKLAKGGPKVISYLTTTWF